MHVPRVLHFSAFILLGRAKAEDVHIEECYSLLEWRNAPPAPLLLQELEEVSVQNVVRDTEVIVL